MNVGFHAGMLLPCCPVLPSLANGLGLPILPQHAQLKSNI